VHAPVTRGSARPGKVPFSGAGVLFPGVPPHMLPHPATAAIWRHALQQASLSRRFDSVAANSPMAGPT